MSEKGKRTGHRLISHDYSRRIFLEQTVLAAAGAAAGTMLPAVASAASQEMSERSGGTCPGVEAPMKDVEGKVAFITGGSSGIGLGIARAFADAGMKVVIGYRARSHLNEAMRYLTKAGDRVHAIRFDVTDRARLEQAAAEALRVFEKVHVLVNNAGVVLPSTLSETSYEDWDWILDVNLNGPFNGVRVFLPHIQTHGEGGHIITTSSTLGLFANGAAGAYTVSKYAVVGMMEALRAELADTNIGTSVLCPGLVKSNIMESSFRDRPGKAGKEDAEVLRRDTQARNDPELAMDPLEVGSLVLDSMRNNDLYIFTHPEFERIIRDRSEALIASIPQNVQPTERRLEMARSRLSTSIYTIERDRRRCLAGRAAQSRQRTGRRT